MRPTRAVRLLMTGCVAVSLLSAVASRQLATVRVSDTAQLQSALERARPGDTILLARGTRFTGNFVLPSFPSAADAFVTIRTDADGLPGDHVRVTPAASGTLAVIESPNAGPALRTAAGAHHWRIENVEFGPTRGASGTIIELGAARQSESEVPHDLILDRVYIHGDGEAGQRRGIALNSASTQILNSYIADIKVVGADAQAIAGWNGPGPFLIENTYLEASGENIMFGGADPSIDRLVPRQIVVRRNHLTRPVAWRGQRWSVKNLFELKNAADVTVEGNLFEHNWGGGQPGYAIVLTPRNQGGKAPWSTVERVVFQNNVVRHVAAGINITGTDDRYPSGRARDITIANNLFLDVDGRAWGGNGDFVQIGRGAADVTIEANTVQHTGRIISAYGREPITGLVFRRNLLKHNAYGVMGDNASPGTLTFERYLPGSVFTENVIAGGDRRRYPGGNTFIQTQAFDRALAVNRGERVESNGRAAGDGAAVEAGADASRIDRALGPAWRR